MGWGYYTTYSMVNRLNLWGDFFNSANDQSPPLTRMIAGIAIGIMGILAFKTLRSRVWRWRVNQPPPHPPIPQVPLAIRLEQKYAHLVFNHDQYDAREFEHKLQRLCEKGLDPDWYVDGEHRPSHVVLKSLFKQKEQIEDKLIALLKAGVSPLQGDINREFIKKVILNDLKKVQEILFAESTPVGTLAECLRAACELERSDLVRKILQLPQLKPSNDTSELEADFSEINVGVVLTAAAVSGNLEIVKMIVSHFSDKLKPYIVSFVLLSLPVHLKRKYVNEHPELEQSTVNNNTPYNNNPEIVEYLKTQFNLNTPARS